MMAAFRSTPPAKQADGGSRFDGGWWWAARLGFLLAIMAALAYGAGQYVGRTGNTAPASSNQIPDNAGYGVGGDTARSGR